MKNSLTLPEVNKKSYMVETKFLEDYSSEIDPNGPYFLLEIPDELLFTSEHFNVLSLTIAGLTKKDILPANIITKINFKYSSLSDSKIAFEQRDKFSFTTDKKLSISDVFEVLIISTINGKVKPSIGASEIMTEIFNLVKGDLRCH